LTEEAISGVLFDLGVSSYQLSGHKRGFSFNTDELLDMRMDPDNQAVTAKELIAALYEKELHELFKKYADENLAGPIARRLVVARREQPITTTGQLRDLVAEVYKRYGVHHKTDPATKVFQALRIAVNDELNNLTFGLKAAWQILRHQGHLVVITFHSGEDRIVKQQFKQWVASNEGSIITKKPLLGKEEKSLNPRSRSAKLRAIVKNDS
jgi:16S rRNA (cytosine1402-N4)-methyltransferase